MMQIVEVLQVVVEDAAAAAAVAVAVAVTDATAVAAATVVAATAAAATVVATCRASRATAPERLEVFHFPRVESHSVAFGLGADLLLEFGCKLSRCQSFLPFLRRGTNNSNHFGLQRNRLSQSDSQLFPFTWNRLTDVS